MSIHHSRLSSRHLQNYVEQKTRYVEQRIPLTNILVLDRAISSNRDIEWTNRPEILDKIPELESLIRKERDLDTKLELCRQLTELLQRVSNPRQNLEDLTLVVRGSRLEFSRSGSYWSISREEDYWDKDVIDSLREISKSYSDAHREIMQEIDDSRSEFNSLVGEISERELKVRRDQISAIRQALEATEKAHHSRLHENLSDAIHEEIGAERPITLDLSGGRKKFVYRIRG